MAEFGGAVLGRKANRKANRKARLAREVTAMIAPYRQGALWVMVVLLGVLVALGCGKQKANDKLAEGMAERTLEHAIGGHADVDIKGEDVEVKTDQGRMQMTKTTDWPSDMFSGVPRFTYGVIERVAKSEQDGRKSYNIYLRDVQDGAVEKYQTDIKEAGWESQSMMQSDAGGMVSAQKGNLGLQFVYNKSDRTGVVMAFSAPE